MSFELGNDNLALDQSNFNPDSGNGTNFFTRAFLPFNKDMEDHFPQGADSFPYSHDYSWIFYASLVFGFITAYGIGANDVANAFATSVGAKALKVWQAVIIAAIFEFAGAVGLGSSVTKTVRKGIVNTDLFTGHEDWLMIGMLTTVIIVGFWLFAATAAELPVSTTHSTVGGIIGFALAAPNGAANVNWEGVRDIVASWFLSPISSGIVAAAIFLFVRTFILRSGNSYGRTLIFFPFLVGFTVALNAAYVIFKGIKNKVKLELGPGMGISFGIGVGAGLIVLVGFVPLIRKWLADIPDEPAESADQIANIEQAKLDDEENHAKTGFSNAFSHQADVHAAIETDARVSSIHENAERFSLRTERAFAYLQVFTAIFDSFSHGANDVANSIGPLAAVYGVYQTGPFLNVDRVNEDGKTIEAGKTEVPIWILVIGGAGIVVGLATYGYKIMAAIGVKMVKVTPTRGFAIELGAAFIIVTGSFFGLPLSTTHCQVGATIGVGITEGNAKEAINWPLLAKVFAGWVFTLVIAGAGTALLFSFAVYSPSINAPVSIENCLMQAATTITSENEVGVDISGGILVPSFSEPNGTFSAVTILAGNPVDGSYVAGYEGCLNGKVCEAVAWEGHKVGTVFVEEEEEK